MWYIVNMNEFIFIISGETPFRTTLLKVCDDTDHPGVPVSSTNNFISLEFQSDSYEPRGYIGFLISVQAGTKGNVTLVT